MKKTMLTSAVSALAFMAGGHGALALDEITVAYFLEWPMPFEYAKANGTYDTEMGVKVNWRAFDTGTAMSAAMASGDVQIAVSQGVPPFVVATSAGQDLQTIGVAVSYSENDNCVVRSDLEITKDNAKELEGKKVAVPLGTAAHYGFLRQMEHFGVDTSKLDIVDMAPPDGAAAIAQGAVGLDHFGNVVRVARGVHLPSLSGTHARGAGGLRLPGFDEGHHETIPRRMSRSHAPLGPEPAGRRHGRLSAAAPTGSIPLARSGPMTQSEATP